MKIKKVHVKPMIIHTKEKAKIHAHEPKGAKMKGSNVYTVERGPKTIGAKVLTLLPSSPLKVLYNPKAFFIHAAWLQSQLALFYFLHTNGIVSF